MKAHFKILILAVCTGTIISWSASAATDQKAAEAFAPSRGAYRADRTAYFAEMLQLTDVEGEKFWPIYRKYAAEKEALGDGLLKLVLEYSDAYPNVPEERARQLLKEYSSLEKDLGSLKTSYLKKISKVLPASKTLRFAQLENRVDSLLRMELASTVPLMPTEGVLSRTSVLAATVEQGTPGGSIVQVQTLTARVVGINQTSRKLTLMDSDGIKQTVKVGPEAANFDQIRIGDRVTLEVTEELVVGLVGADQRIGQGVAGLVALAPKGAKPSGIVAETTQVTATITALDPVKHTATLQFEQGPGKTFPVRSDVDLSKRKIGEKVVVSATEVIALRVEKQ